MTLGRIFIILIFSSLVATGATAAGGAGIKGDHPLLPASVPASVRHARPQASPIVMGRSASVHRKTKLHHIKMKPLESIETPVPADGSR